MKMASSERRPLLLDLNALVALAWPNHPFHRSVRKRLDRHPTPKWATCLLTQLGFVRLSSNPSIVNLRQTPGQALSLLSRLIGDEHHIYFEILPRLSNMEISFRRLLGHQQVTDEYLVAVAEANDATLLTLDQRLVATVAARERVEVLAP
jgi:toxin-antitoxin system PIN domain toxin